MHGMLLPLGWLLLFASCALIAALGGVEPHVRWFQFAWVVSFVGYGLLAHAVIRRTHAANPFRWHWWFLGCVALRLMLVPAAPSDDVYRYVWEGRVWLAGHDPYRSAPDDPRLADLRDEDWAQINHPHHAAIYPPVAQLTFQLAAALGLDRTGVKLLHVLWDVLTMAAIGQWLRARGQPMVRATLYGLCPLVLIAFAVEGHMDSLMLLLIVLGGWALHVRRDVLGGVCIGLAIGARLVPAVLLPWLLFRRTRSGVTALLTVVVCYLPFGGGGLAGVENLFRFGFEGPFFGFVGTMAPALAESTFWRPAAVGLLVVVAVLLARRRDTLESYATDAWTALLMLLPVFHFWYVTWALLYVPLTLRARWLIAAFFLGGYFEATRLQVAEGAWRMPAWVPLTVWSAFLLAWVVEWWFRRRVRPKPVD